MSLVWEFNTKIQSENRGIKGTEKIEDFTSKEQISLSSQVSTSSKKSKNQMRREQIYFTCQTTWTPDHIYVMWN